MRKTTLLLAALLAGTAGWAGQQWLTRSESRPAQQTPAAGKRPTSGKTANQMLTELRSRLRLPPDARFTTAARIIDGFPTESAPPGSMKDEGQYWTLNLNKSILHFPDLPSFEQALVVLEAQVGITHARFPAGQDAPPPSDPGYSPQNLAIDLAQLNQRAGTAPTSQQFAQAARASCRLAVSTPDKTAMADRLHARCLAFAVMARAATQQPMAEELSMAAYAMGYGSAAINLAGQLPAESPWRAYMEGREDVLRSMARRDKNARYLLQRTLATARLPASWQATLEQGGSRPSIEFLATGLDIAQIDSNIKVGAILPLAVVNAVDATLLSTDPLTRLDEALRNKAQAYGGPFYFATDHDTVYRAYLYSGLYALTHAILAQQAQPETATQIESILSASQSPHAQQFALWYRHLIDAEVGRANQGGLLGDLKNIDRFGTPLLRETVDSLAAEFDVKSPRFMDMAQAYTARLDSRLSDREEIGRFTYERLYALSDATRLFRSIIDADPLRANPWYFQYFGDYDALIRVSDNPAYPVSSRARALSFLGETGKHDEQVMHGYEALVASNPYDMRAYEYWFNYLLDHQQAARALVVARDWVKRAEEDKDMQGFGYQRGMIAISKALDALGDTRAAWENLSPLAGFWLDPNHPTLSKTFSALVDDTPTLYNPVLAEATRLLIKLDQTAQAIHLAEKAMERYPNAFTALGNGLAAYWADGQYAKAAKLLATWKRPADWNAWNDNVAVPFARTLGEKPQAAIKAMEALNAAGVNPWYLQTLAARLARDGKHQLAFELQARISAQGSMVIPVRLNAYQYLREARGEQVALSWLQRALEGVPRDYIATVIMDAGGRELLWTHTDPAGTQHPSVIWLYRAAADIMGTPVTEKQRLVLLDHYAKAADGNYDLFGRYLLGLEPEASIADLPLSPRELSEATYYLGLRAGREGRYADMVDWLRVGLDTRMERNGEYRWALNLLVHWRNQHHDFDLIARDGKMFF